MRILERLFAYIFAMTLFRNIISNGLTSWAIYDRTNIVLCASDIYIHVVTARTSYGSQYIDSYFSLSIL